jgi:hypothetical protein
MQEDSLSGDNREEGKVSTPKRSEGTHKLETVKREMSQDNEKEKVCDTHFLQSTKGKTCQNVENKKASKEH